MDSQENRSRFDEYDQATIGGDGRSIKAEALALFDYGWWTEGPKSVYTREDGMNADRLHNGFAVASTVRIDVFDASSQHVFQAGATTEGRAWWMLRNALLDRRYGSKWRERATQALIGV